MTQSSGGHAGSGSPTPLFEDTDVDGRVILLTGIGLVIAIVVFMLISHGLLRALVESPPSANMNLLAVRDASLPLAERIPRIAAPRLEGLRRISPAPSSNGLATDSYEPTGSDQLYSVERRRLDSYGWIDRDHGVIHIPIDRAIAIMAEKGMPYRKNGTSEPQAPAGAKKP